MRHNVNELHYKLPSDIDWTDMEMVPASGTLDIETADTKNGTVRTFRLSAVLPKKHPAGPSYLAGDLRIQVVYDSGYRIQLGTKEMPARVKVSGSETLNITCDWQDAL
jgi:hypothetical protein